MNAVTLCVLPDGTIQGFYSEAIDLTSLGTLKLERVSTIEFDHPCQCWRVFNRYGLCLYSSPSRTECLKFEAEYFKA